MTNQESFEQLFAESVAIADLTPGALITAEVTKVTPDYIFVNAGLKSEARISTQEFKTEANELEIKVGDKVEVVLESIEDGSGETRLSRIKAKRLGTWKKLEEKLVNGESVTGVVTGRVRGGLTVEVENLLAFLPGSLVDAKPVKDASYLIGQKLEFKVIKVDRKNNNIVVSRKAAISGEDEAEKSAILGTLKEGDTVKGIIKNVTDYGAFVDLGGVDGLLYITDISWKRIRHPSEILKVGDEVEVRVLRFDREKNRVSLGMKQLASDPWQDLARRYPVGTRLFGKVTNITEYGCFVEIETGIEGLVHMSEMDWTNRNLSPSKLVTIGQEVEVMVLEIDEQRRRVSLGIKQCYPNPWKEFAEKYKKGDKASGNVKSITDFGMFVGLENGVDGLVHLSDLSWTEAGEKALRKYKKGDPVEVVVLAVDVERERISLGVKQLHEDVGGAYFEKHKNTMVKGKVTKVTPKYILIGLEGELMGRLRIFDIEDVKDMSEKFKVGDEVEAKVINLDRKNNNIALTMKEEKPERVKEKDSSSENRISATLGDILREQMKEKEEKEKEALDEEEKSE
jgi:small subunit ribosomal protein S1